MEVSQHFCPSLMVDSCHLIQFNKRLTTKLHEQSKGWDLKGRMFVVKFR